VQVLPPKAYQGESIPSNTPPAGLKTSCPDQSAPLPPAQCDGNTPCSHCRAHQKDCVYEKSDQRTKSSLRSEVDSLRRNLHTSEAIINALRHSQHRDRIVQQLQGGATNDQIAEMLHALATEDNAAPPGVHTDGSGGHQVPGMMSRMLGGERGAPAAIMPGIAPWSDPDESSELVAAPVCDDATPPTGLFWNPLFAWPVDVGAFLPLDPAVSSLPMHGMGPAGGPLPDVWRS
jgi:Zn(2)-Cys(6) binuclear cluster domain-containing protein